MKIYRIALVVVASVFANTVSASGIPTVDIANIIQTTTSALNSVKQVTNQVQQIKNQIDQYTKLQEQLTQQVRQFQSLTGSYNMGTLLNAKNFIDARRDIPRTWRETLDLLDGATAAAHQSKAQQAARDARTAGQVFAATDVYADDTVAEALRYMEEAEQIFTHIGVGQANYEKTEDRTANMETLNAQIDSANDLKAAIDLQNRISIEQSMLTIEMMRLQSANQINSAQGRLNIHNRRASDKRLSDAFVPQIPAL